MQVLKAQSAAKAKGYSDVLYLDCVHKRYLEEVSSCNIFVVKVFNVPSEVTFFFLNVHEFCTCLCLKQREISLEC